MQFLSIVCLFLLSTLISKKSYSEEFLINIPHALKDTHESAEIEKFYTQVYKGVGITPTFIFIPARRGFIYLNINKIQAEAVRAADVGAIFDLSTRLSPIVANISSGLFCLKKENCKISSKYIYAIPEGYQQGKIICEKLAISCEFFKKPSVIHKLLENNTVQAALYPFPAYKSFLCQSNKSQLYFNELADFRFNAYHFVNSKDEDFINKLTASLKKQLALRSSNIITFAENPNLDRCDKTLTRI